MSKEPRTFRMKHSVFMKSTSRTRHMGLQFTPDTEAEEAELLELVKAGSALIVDSKKKKPEAKETGNDDDGSSTGNAGDGAPVIVPTDDISEVAGVGAATLTKLAALNPPVKTKSELKKFLTETPDQLKEVAGAKSFTQISEYFEAAGAKKPADDSTGDSSRTSK